MKKDAFDREVSMHGRQEHNMKGRAGDRGSFDRSGETQECSLRQAS